EALERRERANGEHVEVGDLAGGQRDALEVLDAVRPLARPVDQPAAVGADQLLRGGDGAHAATSAAGSTPSSSSRASTSCALSSGLSASVSTMISGDTGSS